MNNNTTKLESDLIDNINHQNRNIYFDLLTKAHLAQALCVSVRTVSNWQKEGKIPYIKVGGRCLYSWLEIRESLKRDFSQN